MPSASVIVCYYREELTVLLRTIHSILDRTQPELLREIIVVNDHSDIDIAPNVTRHLEGEGLIGKVKLITPPERSGLIRARLYGAKHATGQALVFLDRSVQVLKGKIEPEKCMNSCSLNCGCDTIYRQQGYPRLVHLNVISSFFKNVPAMLK